ncbi:arsenical resistance protein ArsH [Pseudoalteromonas sp. GB43]
MKYLNDAKFDVTPTFDNASKSKPRVLILYGSLRETSFSRFASEEAARILEHLGAQVKIFNPDGLPLFDNGESVNNQKVQELRELVKWSEAQVWCSPEIHGNMSAVLKNQIDWIPLTDGAVRPTQGKTLAVMQVSGGSQSFNAVNNMRILGRWMRMLTIPNQSSVAKAWQEFDEAGNMKESSFRMRIVDVMEELIKFTLLTRDKLDWLVDRYSERQAAANLQTTKLVDDSKVLEPNS